MPVLTTEEASKLDREATTLPFSKIAAYLQGRLGQRVTAYMAGLRDTRQIGRYIQKRHEPNGRVERRLREGYKAVRMIECLYDAKTAQVWMFGTNTRLDDRAPIGLLREAEEPDQFAAVMRAARQFASGE